MEFKIEKNIPITSKLSPSKFSFMHEMLIGDSFEYKEKDKDKVSAMAVKLKNKHGYHFVTRTNTKGTKRIWRTDEKGNLC